MTRQERKLRTEVVWVLLDNDCGGSLVNLHDTDGSRKSYLIENLGGGQILYKFSKMESLRIC